jgi:UDP-N-acetylglucosamine 2-epimerase (non-hydrolysing)
VVEDAAPSGEGDRRMRIAAVLGTRPEVIKLAPVISELRRRRDAECIVVSTGQHREMLDQMLRVFEIEPDVDLDVMRPQQRLSDLTAELMRRLGDVLAELSPAWVVVQGDTTSTMCGALAAFYENARVAHVEAGLRSGDRFSPFPEEVNRSVVARVADVHFCPTGQSAENLMREGVPPEDVFVTGNTVIDSLLWAVDHARLIDPPVPRARPRRILVTLHRRESHGDAMRNVCRAVRWLARRPDVEIVFPVHRSPLVRDVVHPELERLDGVHLTEPLDYLSLVHVLDSSDVVLTDSGGLQEEAPAFGKPVLVLRETTERPEAIEAGVARLVGTDFAQIVDAVESLLDDPAAYRSMAHRENPFGDGRAAERIVDRLVEEPGLIRAA